MKRKYIAAIFAAILMALFVVGLYWANGFNFDQRGMTAACCLFNTVIFAAGFGLIIASMPD